MKKKFTILITAAFMLLTMMATTGTMWGQSDYSTTYTSGVTLSTTGGTSASTCKVIVTDTTKYDGIKAGTGKVAGAMVITVPSGTKYLHLHTVGWNGESVTLSVTPNTNISPSSIPLTSDSGISNNSPFTLGTPANASTNYYKVITFTNALTANTDLTFTATSGKRFVIWGVNAEEEGGGDDPTINANNVNIAFNATSGSIGYTLQNGTGNVTASISSGDWITGIGTITENTVPFTCSANTGAQRTATITLSYTGATDKVVTITQDATPMTIAEAREQGTGSVVTRGVVTSCVGTTGYIQDNTAAICVYGASLTVGDEILVSGTLTTYKGLLEITSPQVTVLSQNNTVTPTVKTIAEINSDYGTNTLQGMLVKIENAIVTAISGSNTTISQTIGNTTSTIIVRGISDVEYDVDDVFAELTGNIGAYDAAQIANPTNVVVKPTITTDATNSSLAVPDQILGLYDASDYATLKVSGNHLTAGITLNLGANSAFEMSTDLSSWSSTITIPQTNGSITNEEVAIRLKESLTVVQQYADNVTLTSTNAADVTIALTGNLTNQTFTIEQYSAPATAHGTITFAYEGPLYANTIVTLNATPDEGYDFTANSWSFYNATTTDPVQLTITDGNKISMPAYNLAVDATFTAKQTYAITTAVNPANSGTIVTDNTAWEGKTVEVAIEAEDGYTFSALTVTKTGDATTTVTVSGNATDGFTFTMPAYAVTVTATFVVQLNVTYDFTDPENFFTDNTYQTHPTAGTGSSHTDVTTIYYDNASHDQFTASGTSAHYFQSGGYFMLESGSMLTLPTFENYVVTQVILHSSSNHSTSLTVSIVSGENTVADAQTWSTTNTDYTYDIPEAYQASALSVNVTNKNGQFTSITLVRAIPSTDPNIVASNVTVAYGETSGTINYTIQNPVSGNSVTASTSTSWIGSTFTYGDNQVGFTVTEQNNTATDRQGTITLIYGNNLATKEVTITQEHIVVEAPEFNPAGGSYTASQDVALSCTTTGATIYYTLDGTTPDNTSTAYTGTINVSTTTTIKAIAYVGEVASEVAEATYTIIEPFTPTVYTRATSITSGGHYIIVGFDNNNHDNAYAMGEQKTNNRGAVIISEDGTNAIVVNEDVYDFVINYVETVDETDYYSIYDARNEGYLFAAATGSNYLKTETALSINSKWAITFANGHTSIIASQSSNRNVMQFNYASNNQLFSCYSTANQKPIYLYEKSTTVTPITNNTTVASTDFSADVPAGYRLIASPVNMLNPKAIDGMLTGNYDLYYFDENGKDDDELKEWRNYKAGNFLLESGKGYLYASESGVTLNFIGAPYTGTGEIELNYTTGNRFAGWNLIGNPYATASTLNIPFYKMNDNGDGFTAKIEDLTNTISAMEGVFVQATAANQTATFTAQTRGGNQAGIAYVNINVTNTSSSVIDNAIIRFDGGNTLEKFSFRDNNAKIYFKQDNKDYAVVKAEARGEMPVNFKTTENGTFTIDFSMDNVEFDYLHLIDNKTGMDVDLLQTPSYTFEASKIDYASRFRLVFSATNSNVDLGDDFGFFSNGNLMILGIEGEAILQMFDVTGRIINSETFSGSYNKAVNAKAGVYMIRLIQGENVRTQKIIVK